MKGGADVRVFIQNGILLGIFLILLTPLIITPDLFFPFVTGKALFFRFFVGAIFSIYLASFFFSSDFKPKVNKIFYSVSFWIGVAVLATVFSLDVGLSFWSNFERMEGLITFLYLFAYFIVLS